MRIHDKTKLIKISENKKSWKILSYKVITNHLKYDGYSSDTNYYDPDEPHILIDNFIFAAAITFDGTFWTDIQGNDLTFLPSTTKKLLANLLKGNIDIIEYNSIKYLHCLWTFTKVGNKLTITYYDHISRVAKLLDIDSYTLTCIPALNFHILDHRCIQTHKFP